MRFLFFEHMECINDSGLIYIDFLLLLLGLIVLHGCQKFYHPHPHRTLHSRTLRPTLPSWSILIPTLSPKDAFPSPQCPSHPHPGPNPLMQKVLNLWKCSSSHVNWLWYFLVKGQSYEDCLLLYFCFFQLTDGLL